jgi:hypoxanthine phosphoribosyltransferase
LSLDIDFEVPSWNSIYGMLLSSAAKIREDSFIPDRIVGVGRGGWPVAIILSDLLGNIEISDVRVEFYSRVAESRKEPLLRQHISIPVEGMNILIVDDIADTGRSLNLVKEHLVKQGAITVTTATIYLKSRSIIIPEYFERETTSWIVFPWERRETVRDLISRFPVEQVKKKLVLGGMDKDLIKLFINELFEEKSR